VVGNTFLLTSRKQKDRNSHVHLFKDGSFTWTAQNDNKTPDLADWKDEKRRYRLISTCRVFTVDFPQTLPLPSSSSTSNSTISTGSSPENMNMKTVAFQIIHPNRASVTLHAHSYRERELWLTAFNVVLGGMKKKT